MKTKCLISILLFSCSAVTLNASDDYYETAILGYVKNPIETKIGIVATNSHNSELFTIKDGVKSTILKSRNCGLYTNLNKEKNIIGYKSFNDDMMQAPALLNLETGEITLLEAYTKQCGQVSFADDGTMAYTMGNCLVIRKGDSRKYFDLGIYVNIVNISPDATRVAYSTLEGKNFILDLLTGNKEDINLGETEAYNPLWAPDNSKIAFEKVNATLDVYNLSTKKVHSLGNAESAKWLDAENLVFSCNKYAGTLSRTQASSVVRTKFDGSNRKVLIAETEDLPGDVSLTSSGDILVCYEKGAKRGVDKISTRASVSATQLFRISEDEIFGEGNAEVLPISKGLTRPDFGSEPSAPRLKAIGGNEIPYMNQYYDCVSDYNDCTSYGAVCCASTSACMNLGYYGLLDPYPLTSRYTGGTIYYSYYIGRDYTSPITGYTFSLRVADNGCYNIGGAHGYMWYNDAGPVEKMPSFYTNNGMTSSYTSSSYSTFVSESSAGRPYTICLENGTKGHVVLGFRASAISDYTGYIYDGYYGSFVCHDPYGNYNYTYYDYSNDYSLYYGNHATYDWVGYNNGYANIGDFFWGIVAIPPADTKSLTVSHANITMSTTQGNAESVYFTVTGKSLTENITISSSNTNAFTVTPTSLTSTGGNVWITLKEGLDVGTYSTTITVSSSGKTENISVTGYVKEPPLEITEKWNFSDYNGTRTAKEWNAGSIRNFCYNEGKLYCVYDCDKIIVLNAQSGEYIGELPITEYITGGTFRFCDVKYIDGHIVACNLALASKGEEFRVYAWDSDNEAPYVLYTTPNYNGATRIGDCMEVSGTWDNLTLTFANDNGSATIITDYVKDEVDNWTVNTTYYTSDGSTYFPIGNCARAHPFPGGYWIDGSAQYSGWAYNDSSTGNVINSYLYNTGMIWGSVHRVFMWGTTKYCVNLVFNNIDSSTAQTDYYKGGRARLSIVKAGDYLDAEIVGDYPASGLSNTSQNGNATGDVIVNTDNQTYVEMWVCSTNQGMAYYTYGTPPKHDELGVGSINADNNCSIWLEGSQLKVTGANVKTIIVYTVSGIEIARASGNAVTLPNPTLGVYLAKIITADGNVIVKKVVK
ncbi:MAG: hypothetical protein ACI31F_06435 [Muribaculaceae bacterium]